MFARDYRKIAWERQTGQWGTMALITLIYELILGACSGLAMFGVGSIALLILAGPLMIGFSLAAINVIRGKQAEIKNLFDGFNNFANSFLLYLINSIFVALWSLLFVIPGIIKTYSYSMSYYILIDNPKMGANDARKASMELMSGNKWRLFCLDFSFIGWYLLTLLTFGILSFWVTPYHETARAAFYEDLITRRNAQYGSVNAQQGFQPPQGAQGYQPPQDYQQTAPQGDSVREDIGYDSDEGFFQAPPEQAPSQEEYPDPFNEDAKYERPDDKK